MDLSKITTQQLAHAAELVADFNRRRTWNVSRSITASGTDNLLVKIDKCESELIDLEAAVQKDLDELYRRIEEGLKRGRVSDKSGAPRAK